MSIFAKLTSTPAEPELSPELKTRLDQLDERMRTQEKGLKLLELEWQEWYDKFRLMFARLSKRIRDWQAVDDTTDETPPQPSQNAPRTRERPLPGYGHPPLPIRPGKPNYGG